VILLTRARKESASRTPVPSLAKRVFWPRLVSSLQPARSWIQAPGSSHRPTSVYEACAGATLRAPGGAVGANP